MRRRVNLLSLGEETVLSLGIDPNRIMGVVLVVTTLIVSAIVSVAGIVGWIGLIVHGLNLGRCGVSTGGNAEVEKVEFCNT